MDRLYPFEERIIEAEAFGLDVHEFTFESNMKGYYADNIIAINKDLSWTEKNCVMAEEIGHALYNYGNITDQSILVNRKQEKRGRIHAYTKLVSFEKIISAYEAGCTNKYEAAEFLNVTEVFFCEAIRYYHEYYGDFIFVDDYIIFFYENGVCLQKAS